MATEFPNKITESIYTQIIVMFYLIFLSSLKKKKKEKRKETHMFVNFVSVKMEFITSSLGNQFSFILCLAKCSIL